jgi:hypothetical protein
MRSSLSLDPTTPTLKEIRMTADAPHPETVKPRRRTPIRRPRPQVVPPVEGRDAIQSARVNGEYAELNLSREAALELGRAAFTFPPVQNFLSGVLHGAGVAGEEWHLVVTGAKLVRGRAPGAQQQ